LFPELLMTGRWGPWLREARAVIRSGHLGPRGVAARTLQPFLPASLRRRLKSIAGQADQEIRRCTAINVERLAAIGLPSRARQGHVDLDRPWHGFAMRLWVMRRVDLGCYYKGTLAEWGIDQRDPTADKNLVEFCLSVPTEQFLSNGIPRSLARRALADRLPGKVLSERRKGLQAVDWHENLTAARRAVAEEIERLASCTPAAALLDLPRLRRLVDNWPTGGWHEETIVQSYRLALLRGLSVGHFLRSAAPHRQ
jgi:asparagine synthase (glutamine-hydrolysing)